MLISGFLLTCTVVVVVLLSEQPSRLVSAVACTSTLKLPSGHEGLGEQVTLKVLPDPTVDTQRQRQQGRDSSRCRCDHNNTSIT